MFVQSEHDLSVGLWLNIYLIIQWLFCIRCNSIHQSRSRHHEQKSCKHCLECDNWCNDSSLCQQLSKLLPSSSRSSNCCKHITVNSTSHVSQLTERANYFNFMIIYLMIILQGCQSMGLAKSQHLPHLKLASLTNLPWVPLPFPQTQW